MRWRTLLAGAVVEQLDGHNVERLVGHLALARVRNGLHVARAHLDDVAAIELVQSQSQLVPLRCMKYKYSICTTHVCLFKNIDVEQSLVLMGCDAPVDSGGRERAQMAMARSPCATGSSGMRRTMCSSVSSGRPSRRASTSQSFPSETATSCTFRFACMDALSAVAY